MNITKRIKKLAAAFALAAGLVAPPTFTFAQEEKEMKLPAMAEDYDCKQINGDTFVVRPVFSKIYQVYRQEEPENIYRHEEHKNFVVLVPVPQKCLAQLTEEFSNAGKTKYVVFDLKGYEQEKTGIPVFDPVPVYDINFQPTLDSSEGGFYFTFNRVNEDNTARIKNAGGFAFKMK